MLPLSTLVALTDRKVAITANHYRVGTMQEAAASNGKQYNAVIYGGSKPARSILRVTADEPEAKTFCTCSCDYFTVNLETVLVLHGSTAPSKAEGRLPTTRNPKLKPGLCPHLYKLATSLLTTWKKAKEDAEKAEAPPAVDGRLQVNR